jgi:hypothetical protein
MRRCYQASCTNSENNLAYLAPFPQQGEDERHAGALSQLALGLDSTTVGFGYGLRYRETEAAAWLLDFGQPVEAFEDVWEFVASGFPGSEVRVIFPIEGDGFFTDDGGVEELAPASPEPSAG